jgi:putative tryptophan/tyrosine transport system substrate-binding protein
VEMRYDDARSRHPLRRRDFLALLGTAAAALRVGPAYAASTARTIGVLTAWTESDQAGQAYLGAFRGALASRGWTSGGNLRIEYRYAANNVDLIRSGAQELVALSPDVIFAVTAPVVPFLQHATQTIPIVFVLVIDAVALGYVKSLSAPGGNTTGFTNFEPGMGTKWLELLQEVAPATKMVGCMFNPVMDAAYAGVLIRSIENAAPAFSVEVVRTPVRSDEEIDGAMRGLSGAGGLIVLPSNFTAIHRDAIVSKAARYRVPTIYPFDFFAAVGGLMSYGEQPVEEFRDAAGYVDRILRGEKPADLPVQAPTKFELVVNLKAAKSLNLLMPPTILATADQVIE